MFAESQQPHLRFTLCDRAHGIALTDHLQVHTVELPKYNFKREELAASDDLTRRSFFLRESADLDAAELRHLLPHPAFQKAIGVIEMIAHSPPERQEYEARRKAERDENWRMRIAEEKGLARGLEQGLELGKAEGQKTKQLQTVQKLQRILNVPVSPDADLLAMDFAICS